MKKKTNTRRKSNTGEVIRATKVLVGIDQHAASLVVVVQYDNGAPQPAQRIPSHLFVEWIKKLRSKAREVHSCYEAGPCGYVLHRQLEELGINNRVVRPRKLDAQGRGVRTDRTDARQLCVDLYKHLGGDLKVLGVIRVPSVEEERERSMTRFREQLVNDRKRHQAQGNSKMLLEGIHAQGKWWAPKVWEKLSKRVSESTKGQLEILREMIGKLEENIKKLTQEIQEKARVLPRGVGALSHETLRREVGDWGRFKNRRQVGSLSGMCPGIESTGRRRWEGSITKHGNRRIRYVLVEMAWRLVKHQPDYRGTQKFLRRVLSNPGSMAWRKKGIVMMARQLAVDLWRMNTGQTTAKKLGLEMNPG